MGSKTEGRETSLATGGLDRQQLAEEVVRFCADAFGVSVDEIRDRTVVRRQVSNARHLAIYLLRRLRTPFTAKQVALLLKTEDKTVVQREKSVARAVAQGSQLRWKDSTGKRYQISCQKLVGTARTRFDISSEASAIETSTLGAEFEAVAQSLRQQGHCIETGIPELDCALGGGLHAETLTLLTGPSGSSIYSLRGASFLRPYAVRSPPHQIQALRTLITGCKSRL